MRKRFAIALLVLAALAGGLACDNSDDEDTGVAGTYTGTLSGSGVSGTLSLIIAPTSLAAVNAVGGSGTTVSGTLNLGGTPITLVGTFNEETGSLTVAGGGYTFSGQLQAGQVIGQWAGPGGSSGSFVALLGSGGTISVFCGAYFCDTPPSCKDSGDFNLAVGYNVALLAVTVGGGATGAAVGSYIGSAVHFESGSLTVDGTIGGSVVTGTWSDSESDSSGIWQGSTTACSTE